MGDGWDINDLTPIAYNGARRKLLGLALTLMGKEAETYALRDGEKFYLTLGAQLGAGAGRRIKLRRRSALSNMSDRYDQIT